MDAQETARTQQPRTELGDWNGRCVRRDHGVAGGWLDLGVDGLALILVVLTTTLTWISILASGSIKDRVRLYMISFLVLEVGLIGVFVLRADAPRLFDGLVGRALPVMVVSGVAGIASIALLLARRYGIARITSSVAVATSGVGSDVAALTGLATLTESAGTVLSTVTVIVPDVKVLPALSVVTTRRS